MREVRGEEYGVWETRGVRSVRSVRSERSEG